MLMWAVGSFSVFSGLCDEMEYRLTRYLMDRYDASVRPVENASMPLQVTFGVSLHHIIDVVSTWKHGISCCCCAD